MTSSLYGRLGTSATTVTLTRRTQPNSSGELTLSGAGGGWVSRKSRRASYGTRHDILYEGHQKHAVIVRTSTYRLKGNRASTTSQRSHHTRKTHSSSYTDSSAITWSSPTILS